MMMLKAQGPSPSSEEPGLVELEPRVKCLLETRNEGYNVTISHFRKEKNRPATTTTTALLSRSGYPPGF